MPVTLDNGRLRAEFDPLGAQLTSLRDACGTQYIWHADPAVWGRHAPNLFPVIGRLKDGQYTLAGETYSIPPHGFARDSVFTVAGQTDTSVSFRLTDSEETRAVYPFSFALTIAYSLEENCLLKSCTVENFSDRALLYELGGHDGYRVPLEAGETMADYAIRLPGVEELKPYGMDSTGLITPREASFPLNGGRIALTPSAYGLDTVILDRLPRRRASLVDRAGRERVRVDFPDFPYLGLWTPDKPFDTGFVCIEPWSSLPDARFVGRGLEDKMGIRRLPPGGRETLRYTVTCFERSEQQ